MTPSDESILSKNVFHARHHPYPNASRLGPRAGLSPVGGSCHRDEPQSLGPCDRKHPSLCQKISKGDAVHVKTRTHCFTRTPFSERKRGFLFSQIPHHQSLERPEKPARPNLPPPETYPNAKRTRPRRPPEPGPDERDPGRSRDRGMHAYSPSLSANPRLVKPDEAKPFRPVHATTMPSSFSNYRYLTSDAPHPPISILEETRGFPREVCL